METWEIGNKPETWEDVLLMATRWPDKEIAEMTAGKFDDTKDPYSIDPSDMSTYER